MLQGELEGVVLYRALAGLEARPELKEVYGRMAESEERHAARWRKRLVEAGYRRADPSIGWRTRMMIALARRFGSDFILPTIAERERIDSAGYAAGASGIAVEPALAGPLEEHVRRALPDPNHVAAAPLATLGMPDDIACCQEGSHCWPARLRRRAARL